MPFQRYLQDNRQDMFPYDFDSNAPQTNSSSSSSSSLLTAAMDMPISHAGQSNSGFSHSIRLQIPQFMQTGAPMLAPGGGAEVLPVGLFSGNPAANSAWFVNNGITSNLSYSDSAAKTYVYPIDQQQHHQAPSSSSSPSPSSHSSPSPFEFDFNSQSPSIHESEPNAQSPTALSVHINSGLINPQNRLTPHQLNAIGAGAAMGSSSLNAPSPLGLPVYSRSGFDLLSVLARVAARPDPKIALGPVDFSSSFVVIDVRRYDNPIIYCSRSFCRLTGYEEHEIIGKNCRFLQSPNGVQTKGEYRRFTSNEAVSYLKKHLVADKECQTSIINYRKSGDAFINLVTVIPIKGGDISSPHEDDKVIYHVGFQVDLTEQPNAILEKLKDGSYLANFAANNPLTINPPSISFQGGGSLGSGAMHSLISRDRKMHNISAPVITSEFKAMIEDSIFVSNHPISVGANADSLPSSVVSSNIGTLNGDNSDLVNIGSPGNHPLSLLLLEYAPDFIHVVSLKGTFLYVGPSVRRVLGYEPEELVGKALSDICHPADVQPLTRELKESSATGSTAPGSGTSPPGEDALTSRQLHPVKPRAVNLLFRARTKSDQYVWVECRGRLHVEPGKGRKAIMLSGRAKEMSMLLWSAIASAGGISHPQTVTKSLCGEDGKTRLVTVDVATEFWGTVTRTGSLLIVSKGVKDILGWEETELMGKQIWGYLLDEEARQNVGKELANIGCAMGTMDAPGSLPRKIFCRMIRQDGSAAEVELILYPSAIDSSILHSPQAISPAPIIYQIRLYDPATSSTGVRSSAEAAIMHPLKENVFKVLEISRESSWQYELQQMRYMNERLREEIMSLEGDKIEHSHAHSTSSTLSQPSAPATHGLVHVNPSAGTMSSSITILPNIGYDRHAHQGIESASFNAPHIMYPASGQYTAHTQYPQHVQHAQHTQPQAWPPPPSTGSSTTAISMPMPFMSPSLNSTGYDISNTVSSSTSLKRHWNTTDCNGNGT